MTPVEENVSGAPVAIPVSGQALALSEKRDYIITADFYGELNAQEYIQVNIDSAYRAITAEGDFTEAIMDGDGSGITGFRHTAPGLKLPDLADTTITEGQKIVINLAGPYTNIPGRLFAADDLPRGATLDIESGLFEWTPYFDQASVYPYNFSVSVEGSSDTEDMSITVLDIDPLTDLVHADSTFFRDGAVDTLQVRRTGVYTLHRAVSRYNSVNRDREVVVRQPFSSAFTLERILDYPSTVEFIVKEYESGYTFDDSVTIRLEYKDFEILDNEEQMRIFVWNGAGEFWHQVPGRQFVNTDSNFVTATVDHFTVYSVQEAADTLHSTILRYGWNMIGLPAEPDDEQTPRALFADDIQPFYTEEGNSNIYRYSREAGDWYIPETLTRGEGFLLWSHYGQHPVDVTGLQNTSAVTTTLPAADSWALISNPYSRSIDWAADVARTNVANQFYRWTGGQYCFYPGGGLDAVIEPWEAVFVRSTDRNASVTVSYPGPESVPKQAAANNLYDWLVQISGVIIDDTNELGENQSPTADTYNFFGIAVNKQADPRSLQRYELEPLGEPWLSLSFPGTEQSGRLTQQILTDSLAEYKWRLDIRSNIPGGSVLLEWSLPGDFPDDWELLLSDENGGSEFNMREVSDLRIHVPGNDPDQPFDGYRKTVYIIARPPERDASDTVPDSYYLEQNYPNPFNSGTVIRYGIPEASRVTLTVYNVLGQQVRTIVDAEQEAARYSVEWDGLNDAGKPAGSGIYFCSMKTPSYAKSFKMIILR